MTTAKAPLMVDIEVTIKFLIPNGCYYSDIEGQEENLYEIVENALNEEGIQTYIKDDSDFYIDSVKAIM